MDFRSAMETFAEAWVAANSGTQTQALALICSKSPVKDHTETVTDREKESNGVEDCSAKNRSHQSNGNIESSQTNSSTTPGESRETAVNLKLRSNLNSPSENGISSTFMLEKGASSPTNERKGFDFSKVNAKSLPIHCIVESITSLQGPLCADTRSQWKQRPNIEIDSYVIVPAATLFSDLVNTALLRLGYSPDIANTARGSIIVKNWKPLPLENISDNPMVCVNEMLGELTSVITLRIVILRTKPSMLTEIKDKLLKLLVLQSHAVLRSAGCPLDETTLSQICRNSISMNNDVSEEVRRKFDQWWCNQLTPQTNSLTSKILPFLNPQQQNDIDFTQNHNLATSRESLLDNHHHNMIVHPALQTVHSQYTSQKTRMRTSFDPEMELPKLQRWFHENPHPSRQQIQSYVIQLNSLESRRGRKPLDINNVVYWFKNARAAQKRAELRGHGLVNGFGSQQSDLMMQHSDYIKSPISLKSEEIENISQHSDDIDDIMDQSMSSQLPLSLTTHERHRSSTDSNLMQKSIRSFTQSPLMMGSSNASQQNDSINDLNENVHANDNNSNNNENLNERCDSIKNSPESEDLDMESDINPVDEFRSPSPDSRRDVPFPMVPNSMFSHSIMYMSHYIPQMGGAGGHHPTIPNSTSPRSLSQNSLSLASMSNDERRKRNRTFIDPVTEVPKLEQWFAMNTHPSHNLILKYTEDLNRMPYRQKFPRLESKNVQFWFKNRRAKCKRLKMSLYDPVPMSALGPFTHNERD
ncbi:Homeobox protein dve-1 [Pseudolycoriella hygida]|uniref:Homeobox protein dve-1 n=1 Tax=Pseudolycoriella hygida TaxID=35572 RepID=A0A9Q0N2B0_9DIPT|nr:Homeobox protein dve-1 [Pseudolycoriella hygida]